MELREVFDTIPEQFDKYRPRYSPELFADLIAYTESGPDKTVLELGPGTGQATDPVLNTGCDYYAIELGGHLTEKMKQKYGAYPNFHIVNDDFITHDFGSQRFDMIYSAATIQWIPEKVAFGKTFDLLNPGGTLAMMLTTADYCGTHCDHIVVKEPYRSKFFEGLRNAVLAAGDKIVFLDTYTLFLAKKPMTP